MSDTPPPAPLDLARFPPLEDRGRLLLGPGPSLLHPRVQRALSLSLLSHLDPDFVQIMDSIRELLRYVFCTQNPLTLPVSGAGTAAMEAAVANLIEPGDRVLAVCVGYFSEKLAELAGRYGADLERLERPWGQALEADDLRKALQRRPARVVTFVHGETSTGVLQPLDGLVAAAHQAGALALVDTVSTLGGAPLDVDALGIDLCYSGSQKCLGAPPGLGPITVGPRAEKALRERARPVASWFLDLQALRRYWSAERQYHHTAPISTLFALYEGLRLIAEEGLAAGWERHRRNAEQLWTGLEALDLDLFVAAPGLRLPTVTTVCVPTGVDDLAVRRRLLEEHNIEIAGGLGQLKGQIWRIGLMGYSSRAELVTRLVEALREILRSR